MRWILCCCQRSRILRGTSSRMPRKIDTKCPEEEEQEEEELKKKKKNYQKKKKDGDNGDRRTKNNNKNGFSRRTTTTTSRKFKRRRRLRWQHHLPLECVCDLSHLFYLSKIKILKHHTGGFVQILFLFSSENRSRRLALTPAKMFVRDITTSTKSKPSPRKKQSDAVIEMQTPVESVQPRHHREGRRRRFTLKPKRKKGLHLLCLIN